LAVRKNPQTSWAILIKEEKIRKIQAVKNSSVHEDGRFCCMPEGTATAAALTGVDGAAAA
jgi:hypothetical protein